MSMITGTGWRLILELISTSILQMVFVRIVPGYYIRKPLRPELRSDWKSILSLEYQNYLGRIKLPIKTFKAKNSG